MARPGLFDNRKFKRLGRALGSETQALGCLEFMWHTAYESGEDYLGDAADVEAAAHWDGEPGKLCQALLTAGGDGHAGFIEEVPEQPSHYRVHDLFDHAPDYVQKRMVRELGRKQRGVTISDLRRDAARKSHEARSRTAASGEQTADSCTETPANVVQTAANGDHLQPVATEIMQTAANGETPAPAPAPAPAPESQKQPLAPAKDAGAVVPALSSQECGSVTGGDGGVTARAVTGTRQGKAQKRGFPFVLPDWVPVEPWQAFLEMRDKKRATPTLYAQRLLIGKLERLRDAGQNPAAVLNESTVNGWKDLYAVKENSRGNGNRAEQRTADNLRALDAAFPLDR